jgi:membrane-associated protein
MSFLANLFLHLDVVLRDWSVNYGSLIYALVFVVIFMETGFVVTPFLPGDSLLFAAGAVSAISGGGLNVVALGAVLFAAAVLGDLTNYCIGRFWGRRILASRYFSRFIKPRHVAQTEAFFVRHGGKTVSLARFVPFVRTFAPFVAGISRMRPHRFIAFSVAGTASWILVFVTAGYLFGNIPFVAHNLEYIVIGAILISLLPVVWHSLRTWRSLRRQAGCPETPVVEIPVAETPTVDTPIVE